MSSRLTENAKRVHDRMYPNYESTLAKTDPEFIERFDNFAFDEVINDPHAQVDDRTRFISLLAVLMGCQGIDDFKLLVPAALRMGVTPVELKEIVYQGVDYLGMGRVFPFLRAVNDALTEGGVPLPLPGQATTTMENRLEKGSEAQMKIFGPQMADFAESGPENERHINRWLVDNCFGDFYTRTGFTLAEREMITFCFLYAQGGCEPQLKAHIAANFRMGNDQEFLIRIVSNNVPFIGYPRTLNALTCLREVAQQQKL